MTCRCRFLPPTPAELLENEGRDILAEAVPSLTWTDGTGTVDATSRVQAELKARYSKRRLAWEDPDVWLGAVQAFVTPERLDMLARQCRIYATAREGEMDYGSYSLTQETAGSTSGTSDVTGSGSDTRETQAEELPDTPLAEGDEYLSSRGKESGTDSTESHSESSGSNTASVKTVMEMPVSPEGMSVQMRRAMSNIWNPIYELVKELDRFFLPYTWTISMEECCL